jgi:hypothetical protein
MRTVVREKSLRIEIRKIGEDKMLKPMNEETRSRAAEARKARSNIRKKHCIPAPVKAIRVKCLECTCGSVNEVKLCHLSDCPLYPYRFSRNPKEEDLLVPEFNKVGDLTGYREYPGFGKVS